MQVFVTSESLYQSSQVLDPRRANKQIIECNQIYLGATGATSGWSNHCITRLWKDDLTALMYFAWCCYYNRIHAGGSPIKPVVEKIHGINIVSHASNEIDEGIPIPHFVKLSWWTNAMKSHLLAKDYDYYSKFWPNNLVESGYYAINKLGEWQKYSTKKIMYIKGN